ncbi:MAG: lipopolysaccharide kinase InaA family protein [Nitrososphaerota archaeon]
MSVRRNLHVGDEVLICRKRYVLVKRLSGGFQFRTWLARDLGRSGKRHKGNECVVKMTTDHRLATSELKAYIYLEKNNFPERYYSEMLAFDNKATAYRQHKRVGRFCAIVLKKYDGSLKSLTDQLSKKEKEKIARKIERRVEKLHKLGMIHGDLREENILIRKSRKGIGVLLTDFAKSVLVTDARKQKVRKLLDREEKRVQGTVSRLSQ